MLTMRITAGKWRNQKVHTPTGAQTRPTPSRVREAIFNICQGIIENADVLDLFAGSGIMSLEALSRGASTAILIENSPTAKRCIQKNLETFEANAKLVFGDVFQQLKRLQERGKTFDLIYADPPYSKGFGEQLLSFLDQSPVLQAGGILFLEEGEKLSLPLKTMTLKDVRSYGKTYLHQFIRS